MGYSFLLVYMPHNFFYLMPEMVNFILLLSFIVVHSEVMWSLSLWGSQSYFVSHLIYLGRCWAFAAARSPRGGAVEAVLAAVHGLITGPRLLRQSPGPGACGLRGAALPGLERRLRWGAGSRLFSGVCGLPGSGRERKPPALAGDSLPRSPGGALGSQL